MTIGSDIFQAAAALGSASRMAEYRAWYDMKLRCTNPNRRDWKWYGGRGISVCERWAASFANFFADIGPRPSGFTIDRIDVNGNYEPGNVRWTTWSVQRKNRRPKGGPKPQPKGAADTIISVPAVPEIIFSAPVPACETIIAARRGRPRCGKEADTISRARPWIAAGISRATWYRQKQACRGQR